MKTPDDKNNIVALNVVPKDRMSSVEVAEMTGKRHDNVMRDIEVMLSELGISLLRFEASYINTRGRTLKCYHLPRREALILVTGYDVVLRSELIDRVEQLENLEPVLPKNLPDALRALANAEEEKAELSIKAGALDLLSDTTGALSIRDSAKQLKIKPSELTQWLLMNRWTLRNGGNVLVPYQSKIESGYLTTVTHEANGALRIQTLVTSKGLAKLASIFILLNLGK